MPSESRIILRIRLEDAVALAFFLVYILLAFFFRELRHQPASSINILIIIPAVCLLLAKEITHNFVSGKISSNESGANLRVFIRPYWEIIRDWLPFFIL